MTPAEQRRLRSGPAAGERPGGIGTIDIVVQAEDAAGVLRRVREVLLSLPEVPEGAHLSPDRWRPLLPAWFTNALPPDWTPEERAALRAGRTPPQRTEEVAAGKWTLRSWLFQLEPEQRSWWWWDARVDHPRALTIEVEVDDWPVAVGSLVWVLTVAGAVDVDVRA